MMYLLCKRVHHIQLKNNLNINHTFTIIGEFITNIFGYFYFNIINTLSTFALCISLWIIHIYNQANNDFQTAVLDNYYEVVEEVD